MKLFDAHLYAYSL